jgi:hypothetical protein
MSEGAPSADAPARRLRQIRIWLTVAIAGLIAMALSDAGEVAEAEELRRVVAQYGWGRVPPSAIDAAARSPVFDLLGIGGLAGMVALGFCVAYAYRLAEALDLPGPTYSMGWTIASFFIPVVVLWRPWQGMRDVRWRLQMAGPDRAMAGPVPKLGLSGLAFAIAWIVGNGAGGQQLKLMLRGSPSTAREFYDLMDRTIALGVFSAVGAVAIAVTMYFAFSELLRLGGAIHMARSGMRVPTGGLNPPV